MKAQKNRSGCVCSKVLDRAGFTLVEMMLVFLLIGIMVSVAIPRWREVYSETSIHESSKMIAALVHFARERSVLEHRNYRLVLDRRGNTYWLEKQTKFAQSGAETYGVVKDILTKRFQLPEHFYFAELTLNGQKAQSSSFVTFYPDGTSDESQITLANESGEKWRIRIPDRFGQTVYEAQ
jgi:prepilin-type N-terminal cleavage/methylation domain-containing protein